MNKKISTLFTAGLLVAGSLFSSAWAADLIKLQDAESGTYKLVVTSAKNSSEGWKDVTSNLYVGVDDNGNFVLTDAANADLVDLTVHSAGGNVRLYSFKVDGNDLKVSYTSGEEEKESGTTFSAVLVDGNGPASALQFTEDEVTYYISHEAVEGSRVLVGATAPSSSVFPDGFQLEEVAGGDINEPSKELNSLYNEKGFNFSVGEDVDGNLFDNDKIVISVDVTDNYPLSSVGANGKDLIIPKGTYFFTDLVWKKDLTNEDVEKGLDYTDIDWPASTVIYASPTETVETTNDDIAKGQGFQLAEGQINDFIFNENASEYVVGDLPIVNACFTVREKGNAYGLRIADFRYQKASTDDYGTKLETKQVDLGVLTISDAKYLCTKTAGDNFDFTLSDSEVLDGKDLLNTTKTAAVYSIQFVAGNQLQSSLVGKYLTLGTENNGNLEWIAKSAELTNTDFPIFQYTITAVEKAKKNDEKYSIVTFTNRETGQYFKAKLYPETVEGVEGALYSMSFPKNDAKFEGVTTVSIARNGYGTVVSEDPVKVNPEAIVRLTELTIDQYAGFSVIEDKAIRTIRYARDVNETSNVWYTGVLPYDGTPAYTLLENKGDGNNKGYFVEEALDAAQFQINVVPSTASKPNPSTIARTYVYWNETTKSVDHVANGDVISAYRYTIQYVSDGAAQNAYFSENGTDDPKLDLVEPSEDAPLQEYYIKENVDGSIALIRNQDAFKNENSIIRVAPYDAKAGINVVPTDDYEYVNYGLYANDRENVYNFDVKDTDLNVYFDDEIPSISWENEGHVTLQNNTLSINGNYISMNEKNEGIMVANAGDAYFLYKTDDDAIIPSFYITRGMGSDTERMFLFNPIDSVEYQVNTEYDPEYMLGKSRLKAMFKAGSINDTRDQMTISVKGETRKIEEAANADGDIWAGLNRFKFQIVKVADEDAYYIRQLPEHVELMQSVENYGIDDEETRYLASHNEYLYLTTDKADAMEVVVEKTEGPVANETIADEAEGVQVIAGNGAVTIQGAVGKTVVITNILGKAVANTTLTSDNQTINVPAGIVVVTVDGEAVKAIVK